MKELMEDDMKKGCGAALREKAVNEERKKKSFQRLTTMK